MSKLTPIQRYWRGLSPLEKTQVANRAGMNKVYLVQVVYGHRTAGPLMARKIQEATEGNIPAEELRPDVYGGGFLPSRDCNVA